MLLPLLENIPNGLLGNNLNKVGGSRSHDRIPLEIKYELGSVRVSFVKIIGGLRQETPIDVGISSKIVGPVTVEEPRLM